MIHLDLFSGIGGFALAAQTVWGSDYRCVGFCEIDSFCQQVLRKNFEGVRIYGDIRTLSAERLIADANGDRQQTGGNEIVATFPGQQTLHGARGCGERPSADTARDGRDTWRAASARQQREASIGNSYSIDLLTGGFPCQPFSVAGKQRGTEDDRYLWPEMLRVIREVKPRWIIGENVFGIIEMALGQVCADLEGLGYEVQCFVIPACAVNAPHRRDRVWIVGHLANSAGLRCNSEFNQGQGVQLGNVPCREVGTGIEPQKSDSNAEVNAVGARLRESEQEGERGQRSGDTDCPSSDPCGEGLERCEEAGDAGSRGETSEQRLGEYAESRIFPDWSRDWREVAFESCVRGVDDGLSRRVARLPDGSTISESKWRQEALKCYGNSIVPQVAMEIMRAIKAVEEAAKAESSLECAA